MPGEADPGRRADGGPLGRPAAGRVAGSKRRPPLRAARQLACRSAGDGGGRGCAWPAPARCSGEGEAAAPASGRPRALPAPAAPGSGLGSRLAHDGLVLTATGWLPGLPGRASACCASRAASWPTSSACAPGGRQAAAAGCVLSSGEPACAAPAGPKGCGGAASASASAGALRPLAGARADAAAPPASAAGLVAWVLGPALHDLPHGAATTSVSAQRRLAAHHRGGAPWEAPRLSWPSSSATGAPLPGSAAGAALACRQRRWAARCCTLPTCALRHAHGEHAQRSLNKDALCSSCQRTLSRPA